MNIITCLVLNRPYNISQVLFDHLIENIRGEKYIMYTWFIQMIIDDQVTNLPKDLADVMNFWNMKSDTLNKLNQYKLKKEETEPRVKHMICKIANQNYVAPENDAWRHDNSNSEDETDRLSGLHEKKLRYWFVKDGKRKRTPKASPTVTTPKVSRPKIVVKGIVERGSHKKMLDPSDVIQQGVDLMKKSLEGFLKKNEEATTAKDHSSSVQAESVKDKEPEGVAHTNSSDVDGESSEIESEIEKIGVGKVQLKKKPQKKKVKEKKKLRIKHKAVQSGIIPRNVKAKKGSASLAESKSGKSEKYVISSKGPEVVKDKDVQIPEVQNVEDKVGDDEDVVISDERVATPPPPTPEKKDDAESSKPKKTTLPDLKKEKAKEEADSDKLKKQLEELTKANEEIKIVCGQICKEDNDFGRRCG
ncbi:hypothetical protein Hanom_Chr15g01403731 [Helianthus anomalus]